LRNTCLKGIENIFLEARGFTTKLYIKSRENSILMDGYEVVININAIALLTEH
jgi:hypothetical protein